MPKWRTSAIVALILGPAIGAACPFIQVAFECRAPESEACVWGKALLPVSVTISAVLVGAVVAAALFLGLEWRRRARERNEGG
jgi:fructose-specific phosphotransferase system IIC component